MDYIARDLGPYSQKCGTLKSGISAFISRDPSLYDQEQRLYSQGSESFGRDLGLYSLECGTV